MSSYPSFLRPDIEERRDGLFDCFLFRVVVSAADVLMMAVARGDDGFIARQGFPILAGFQDRLDASVGTDMKSQRPAAGRINPGVLIALG